MLETRWEKRTFPIQTIKRILGSNAHQSIERDLTALADLVGRLGGSPPDLETGLAALESVEADELAAFRDRLIKAIPANSAAADAEAESTPSALEGLAADLLGAVPERLDFVVEGLFGQSVTHWVRELETHPIDHDTEETVLAWLDDHRAALERPPFDNDARQAYSRFLTVVEFREKTDDTELLELERWVEGLRQLHSDSTPDWTDSLPADHAEALDCPPFVAHICIQNRVESLTTDFCDSLDVTLADTDFDWRSVVDTYVTEGSVPELGTETGAKDHQQRAFSDLARTVGAEEDDASGLPNGLDSNTVQPEIARSSISASEGGGTGGGSTQFRGRGQQAEAYVMAGVLDQVANWIEASGTDLLQFRNRFKQLRSNQQNGDYSWHVKTAWESDLLPLLNGRDRMTSGSITGWRSLVADDTDFTDLPLIELINVTMERGPGFDIIDPLGPVSNDQGRDDFGLWFTPVEVKAVNGAAGPFGFRLTINEYRQAKAFVRDGIPYVIRLVSVPEAGTLNWPEQTEIVAEKILQTEDELEDIIGSHRFENVIKGGYMNMQIE